VPPGSRRAPGRIDTIIEFAGAQRHVDEAVLGWSAGCAHLDLVDTGGDLAGPGPVGGDAEPVPPGNSIASFTCRFACAGDAVMVGWPGAAQDHLPAHALAIRPDRPGVTRGPGKECRVAGTPARERGAAPACRPGAVRAS
jgi:hypothetical protein